MECFKDYIGLLECNRDNIPDSGLYINSLPGISTEVLQKITKPEEKTYDQVWDNIQLVAGRKFYTDTIAKLRENYNLKTVRALLEFEPTDTSETESLAADQFRGIKISLAYQIHTFQAFTVYEIPYLAQSSGEVTFKITDAQGNVLWTKTATVSEGLNRVRVEKIFTVSEIYIGVVDNSGTTTSTSFAENTYTDFCGQCKNLCGCEPLVEGFISGSPGVYTDTSRETHGVGIVGYMGCSYEALVCSNKELLASAWLYLLGIQITIHVLASPRSNQFTTVDRTKFEELRDHYQVEYEKSLAQALAGISVDVHDCCVECNENPKSVQWLP